MAALADILSPVWTLSKNGGGQITEGLNAIRQCLDLIITTTKGSDPLRPEFGCDVVKYADTPINQAAPLITKAILDAISTWETRVTVDKITWSMNNTSNLIFNIGYSLTPDLADTLRVTFSGGIIATTAVPGVLILKGLIPDNANKKPYTINLTFNGQQCYPLAPVIGFTSVADMFNWVCKNWNNYGVWFLTPSTLVCQANNQYTNGEIRISLLDETIYKAVIPTINAGQNYSITINVGNNTYSASELFTMNDILNFVCGTPDLAAAGTWALVNGQGDFNNDYLSPYFIQERLYLVLYTQLTDSININITAN